MLPEGWAPTTLGEAITEAVSPPVPDPSSYPLLTVRLHGLGVISSGKRPNKTRGGRPHFVRKPGEIIVGRQNFHRGSAGFVPYLEEDHVTSNAISAFAVRPGFDPVFVLHSMLHPNTMEQAELLMGGTGQQEISIKKLLSLEIVAPPLAEQRAIVAVLALANRAVEAAARHVADANHLFAAVRGQAAAVARDADRRSEIRHFAKVTKGSSPTMRTGPGTYPFVVTAEEPRTAPQWQIEGPAVCVPLISSTGHGHASIKRLHLAHDKFALANLLAAIHQIDGSVMIPSFLYHLLTHLKDELLVPLMSGTANVTMSVSSLERLVVPLPPLAEQQAIVARIEKVEAAVRAAEAHLERLRALRSSLLENLVSGRVRLPVPDATASEAAA